MLGVESNGVPGIVVSTSSAPAKECEVRRSATSVGLNPAKIVLAESVGSGTNKLGAGSERLMRLARSSRAVGKTDCSRKLDYVCKSHHVL